MEEEYWVCIIGKLDRDRLPPGADAPLRAAVRRAYLALTGQGNEYCLSGWGVNEEQKEKLLNALMEGSKHRKLSKAAIIEAGVVALEEGLDAQTKLMQGKDE